MKFAAFIITFNRLSTLIDSINIVLTQSLPPEKLLIIDNSTNDETEKWFLENSCKNPTLEYYKVGYNSGPAGGAYFGLKILAEEGFEWIFWGDDDDPPDQSNIFEILIRLAMDSENCGAVGKVGQFFNFKTGIIERVADSYLIQSGSLSVHHIAGGMIKIVNGRMIREHNILPDPSFFFGFEDLDIDLKILKAGYRLYVDKNIFYESRKRSNAFGLPKRLYAKLNEDRLWRSYYSTRNLLYIYKANHLYIALCRAFLIGIVKSIYNFKYGIRLGKKYTFYNAMAFFDFLREKKGLVYVNKSK